MRQRLRGLGIEIGDLPTGPENALTDDPGVMVGHSSVIRDEPAVARALTRLDEAIAIYPDEAAAVAG